MNSIGNFFDKFKNLALFELKKREVISKAIESVTKQKIEPKDISIREGIIQIKGNSGLKSEIFLKKPKIIELISKNLPQLKVHDIK